MAVAVAVAVLIVAVAVSLFLDTGRTATAPDRTVAPSAATSSGQVTPPDSPTPTATKAPEEQLVVIDEGEDQDHQPVAGVDSALSPDERVVAYGTAVAIAVALTTQDPDEDRAARLTPLFAAGAEAVGDEGPGPFGAIVRPQTLSWVENFEPEDPNALGLLVSMRYETVRQGSGGQATFGEGDAEWRILLVQDGAGGWLAADAELAASTDS